VPGRRQSYVSEILQIFLQRVLLDHVGGIEPLEFPSRLGSSTGSPSASRYVPSSVAMRSAVIAAFRSP